MVAVLMFFALVAARLASLAWSGSMPAAAALALLAAMLVQNMFDPLLSHGHVLGLFWLVILVGLLDGEEAPLGD